VVKVKDINSKLRKMMKSIYFLGLKIKWNYQNSYAFGINTTAHILCVKNGAYAGVAVVAAESFLYWNPESNVVVHCDTFTFARVSKKFRRLIRTRKVQVIRDIPSTITWQEAKIEIVCSLSGTSDIYMDADLRWNGPCPRLTEPVFYVREFEISSRIEFNDIYTKVLKSQWPSALMSNTSFVFLNRREISHNHISDIRFIFTTLFNWLGEEDAVTPEISQINRLSEQIALSVVLNDALQMGHLKQTDQRADGQFVETSYFGATGLGF
jgi:hypothetical protein